MVPAADRAALLGELAGGYHERRAVWRGTRSPAGHLVKVYAVTAPGRRVGPELERAAVELADRVLAGQDDSVGLGVLVVHAGADGDYVVLQSWIRDYATRLVVFAGRAGEPLTAVPPGIGPCVWEAAVLARERAVYVERVLAGTGPVEQRVRAWADDVDDEDPLPSEAPVDETEQAAAYAVLDGTTEAHLAFVVGGRPVAVVAPIVRSTDLVYVYPDGNCRLAEQSVCLSASGTGRPVVVRGTARPVTDPAERERALTALTARTGSTPRSVAPLAIPLTDITIGERRAHPARSPWRTVATLHGEHVLLEPLTPVHAPDLFAATDDGEVWRYLHLNRPRDVADMADIVSGTLREQETGARVAWVQREAGTGTVVGTVSYYELAEERGALAIGHTILGRPWWRTGINTEAKLLLLTRAFEELSAGRVEWHVDTANERSRRAVERIGGVREGVLRRHHLWPRDGSARDMVVYSMTSTEWPEARARLRARLSSG